jgi:hypothetical protein
MAHNQPLVSILVLNHNGKAFLDDLFLSLRNTNYPHFEVMLIDNASTDDSVTHTQQHYPWVKLLETGVNGGFSYAYNEAFKQAGGRYLLLLNNDVTVDPDWLRPMVSAMESDPSIGAVQPKLVSMLDPTDFEYAGAAGGFMDRYGFPFLRGRVFNSLEKDKGQYDDEATIFWTTGAAMLLRADALAFTGGLDEDFVHHMEEIDLCWRLNLVGYQLKVIPEGKVYHYGGATITPDSYRKLYWNHRNSLFMLIKNVDSKQLLPVLAGRWGLDLLAIGFAITKFDWQRARAIIAGHNWLVLRAGYIRKKRKAVQAMRRVSDQTLSPLFYHGSVALAYFLQGKRTFSELMPEKVSATHSRREKPTA